MYFRKHSASFVFFRMNFPRFQLVVMIHITNSPKSKRHHFLGNIYSLNFYFSSYIWHTISPVVSTDWQILFPRFLGTFFWSNVRFFVSTSERYCSDLNCHTESTGHLITATRKFNKVSTSQLMNVSAIWINFVGVYFVMCKFYIAQIVCEAIFSSFPQLNLLSHSVLLRQFHINTLT